MRAIVIIFFMILIIPKSWAQILGEEELVPRKPDINGIIVLPDGRRCRGIVEFNNQGKEYTRIISCEGEEALLGDKKKHKSKRTREMLEDGEPHYNFKLGFILDPRVGFNEVRVGNTITKADMVFNETLNFELEYGYFNRYAWNFVVGAGFDFSKRAKSTVYNFGVVAPQPIANFTSINIFLNVYRAFEFFYFMLGGGYIIPQANFDQAKSSNARGSFGWRFEVGHNFVSPFSVFFAYRNFNFEADAIAENNNNFNYRKGFYSDYLVGVKYYFR